MLLGCYPATSWRTLNDGVSWSGCRRFGSARAVYTQHQVDFRIDKFRSNSIDRLTNLPSIGCRMGLQRRLVECRIRSTQTGVITTKRSPLGQRRRRWGLGKGRGRMFALGSEAVFTAGRPADVRREAMRTIHISLVTLILLHFSIRANSFNWNVS